jgi:hypothetical protein
MEDHASSRSNETKLIIRVEDFPTSENLQTKLIKLNGFKLSVLEALEGVMISGRSIASRNE